MICEKAMELMSAELDGELSAAEAQELKAHLDRCEDCRRLYEAMTSIDGNISALAEPAPAGLKQGVMYQIGKESGRVKPAKRRFFGVGTGLGIAAAALVLMVGTGLIRLPGRGSASAPKAESLAALPNSAAVSEQDPPAEPEFPESFSAVKGIPSGSLLPAETRAPEGLTAGVQNYGFLPFALDDARRAAFEETAAEKDAPLLVYADFSYESLLALLEEQAPELADRLADSLRTGEDGMTLCRTDWETALALQEWLLAVCPGSNDSAADGTGPVEGLEALDPGSEALFRVIRFPGSSPAALAPEAFPAAWPEDWAEAFLQAENWGLFFPEEDYVPHADSETWLVFPAEP